MEYDFTNSWFEQTGGLNNFENFILHSKPLKILEIGSYEGAASSYLIEHLGHQEGFELHCIDTWEGGIEHGEGGVAETDMQIVEMRFNHNIKVAKSKFSEEVTVHKHKMTSDQGLVKLLAEGKKNYFDFIYVDGSHQPQDVLIDAVLAFKLVRVGGIIGFDDYLWSEFEIPNKNLLRTPKIAIDSFVNIYFNKVISLHSPLYQYYVKKILD